MKKYLIALISLLSVSLAQASCVLTVEDIAFGDLQLRTASEFSTSGLITIRCDNADLGKSINIIFDKDSITMGSKTIPVKIFLRSSAVTIGQTYTVSAASPTTTVPITMKIMSTDTERYQLAGLYQAQFNLTYSYD